MTATIIHNPGGIPDGDAAYRLDAASRRLHAAEGQLHMALKSGVDAWEAAAYDTLHAALQQYLAAKAVLAS